MRSTIKKNIFDGKSNPYNTKDLVLLSMKICTNQIISRAERNLIRLLKNVLQVNIDLNLRNLCQKLIGLVKLNPKQKTYHTLKSKAAYWLNDLNLS